MNSKKGGFTLIEVLFAASIALVILGAALGVTMQVRDSGSVLKTRAAARTEAERAVFSVSRELGQASLASITSLPGAAVRYRIAVDADGDGTALDANRQVEWSAERVIQRDTGDANHDGLGAQQLVMLNGAQVTVLANGLAPDEIKDGVVVRPGLWFESVPGGAKVVVCMQKATRPDIHLLTEELAEIIFVRNP